MKKSRQKRNVEKTGERSVKELTLSLIHSTCDPIMPFTEKKKSLYLQGEGSKMRIEKKILFYILPYKANPIKESLMSKELDCLTSYPQNS